MMDLYHLFICTRLYPEHMHVNRILQHLHASLKEWVFRLSIFVYEFIRIVADEDVLPSEVHEEVIIAVPFLFLDVALMLVLVYLHTQHGVVDKLPQVDSPLGGTTASLEVNVEGLVVYEAIILCCYMAYDLHLLGFLPYRLASWVLWK